MDEKLKNLLVEQAKTKGMCLPNYRPLQETDDIGELIAMYKRTIDWALENQYPDYDTLRRHFSNCGKYGIFVGKNFVGETLKDHAVYVFHNCRGEINVEMNLQAQVIPMLYFANGCDMKIVCKQENPVPIHVPLYIFGDNKIKAKDGKNAVYSRYEMDLM